jgi:hypothetical protein
MNQSAYLAAALLAGFVLFVAARGRLVTYADVLWGNTKAPLPQFLGIPLLTAPAPTLPGEAAAGAKATPGGGGGAANDNASASAAGEAAGSAASNDNWLATVEEVAPYVEEAAAFFGL